MTCIYLRISKYLAAFFRGDGQGNSISPSQPVEFSPYTKEYAILSGSPRIIPAAQQHRAACYSQSAWSNLVAGRPPQGGKQIISRRPSEPLSYAEYCALEGVNNTQKSSSFDFLCIAVPREIFADGRVRRSNATMTLDANAARDLRRLLRRTFVRVFLDFKQRNLAFSRSQGFSRSNVEIIERFLMIYDIPVGHDLKERESLRRLMIRWEREAAQYAQSPIVSGDEIIARIDEHELRGGLPKYD